MKRVGYLYDNVISQENIKKAIGNASKGKMRRKDVRKCFNNRDNISKEMHHLLKNNDYIFQKGIVKTIKETHKERKITVPKFEDLVVQYAILEELKPVIMRGMYKYSCGNINGRGVLYAKKYTEVVVKKYQPKYALKLDIKKFYHNIDINILMVLLRRKIKDKKLLDLIYQILKIGSENNKGLPIGYYTSQWLSNFYLERLDHYIKQELKVKWYVRYVDDMVLFSNNKKELHKIKNKIEFYLREHLKLELKDNWQVFPIKSRAVDFAGYKINYNSIKLRKRTLKILKRRKRKILNNQNNIFVSRSFLSYVGWLIHTKIRLNKKYKKAIEIAKDYVSKYCKRRLYYDKTS